MGGLSLILAQPFKFKRNLIAFIISQEGCFFCCFLLAGRAVWKLNVTALVWRGTPNWQGGSVKSGQKHIKQTNCSTDKVEVDQKPAQ